MEYICEQIEEQLILEGKPYDRRKDWKGNTNG